MPNDEIEQSNRGLNSDIVNDVAAIAKYYFSKGADEWIGPPIQIDNDEPFEILEKDLKALEQHSSKFTVMEVAGPMTSELLGKGNKERYQLVSPDLQKNTKIAEDARVIPLGAFPKIPGLGLS